MPYRAPDNAHRCTGRNANGVRCYAWAAHDSKVCRYHTSPVERDALREQNEHLKAEYAELNDLYYTIRGLVADGQDITVLIEQLRKQIDALRAETQRLKKDNDLAANELVEYARLLAAGGDHKEAERLKAREDAMHAENERLREEATALDALIDRGLFSEIERLRALMHRLWHQRKDMEVASIEFPRVSRDDLLAVRDELAKPNCC